jgi:RimJ/RimL family protein N-acetyltransferase
MATEDEIEVRLEPLAVEHLPHIMTWVNDREVMQYFANHQQPIGEAEELVYLESLLRSKNDFAYSIFLGSEYVGQCSINQIYWPAKNGRVFIVVKKEAQGRRIGPRALQKLVDLGFGEHGLYKLWLIVRRDNRDAQAMYLKLGFDFEGVLKAEYCVAKKFYDMVRMAILRPW